MNKREHHLIGLMRHEAIDENKLKNVYYILQYTRRQEQKLNSPSLYRAEAEDVKFV